MRTRERDSVGRGRTSHQITTADLIARVNARRTLSPPFNRNRLNWLRSRHPDLQPERRIGSGILLWGPHEVDRILTLIEERQEVLRRDQERVR